jgi:hypothetical protein
VAKTSTTKGFDDLTDPESFLFASPGGAAHYTADAVQANNQGVIVRQQGVWACDARCSESDA